MASDDGSACGAHEQHSHSAVPGSYLFPVLATVTAMSIMAAASASIGVWKDVSVMRESMSTLIKNNDAQQKEYREGIRQLQQTMQSHEIRLAKGKL